MKARSCPSTAERAEALAALRADAAFQAAPPALQEWVAALIEHGEGAEHQKEGARDG